MTITNATKPLASSPRLIMATALAIAVLAAKDAEKAMQREKNAAHAVIGEDGEVTMYAPLEESVGSDREVRVLLHSPSGRPTGEQLEALRRVAKLAQVSNRELGTLDASAMPAGFDGGVCARHLGLSLATASPRAEEPICETTEPA